MARLCCGLFVLLLQAVGGLGSVAAAIDRSAAGPGADVANLGADVGESRHRCGGRARSFASLGCTDRRKGDEAALKPEIRGPLGLSRGSGFEGHPDAELAFVMECALSHHSTGGHSGLGNWSAGAYREIGRENALRPSHKRRRGSKPRTNNITRGTDHRNEGTDIRNTGTDICTDIADACRCRTMAGLARTTLCPYSAPF